MIIELHNGELSYYITKVVYRNKEFNVPVYYSTIVVWEEIFQLLKSGKLWQKK